MSGPADASNTQSSVMNDRIASTSCRFQASVKACRTSMVISEGTSASYPRLVLARPKRSGLRWRGLRRHVRGTWAKEDENVVGLPGMVRGGPVAAEPKETVTTEEVEAPRRVNGVVQRS